MPSMKSRLHTCKSHQTPVDGRFTYCSIRLVVYFSSREQEVKKKFLVVLPIECFLDKL